MSLLNAKLWLLLMHFILCFFGGREYGKEKNQIVEDIEKKVKCGHQTEGEKETNGVLSI